MGDFCKRIQCPEMVEQPTTRCKGSPAWCNANIVKSKVTTVYQPFPSWASKVGLCPTDTGRAVLSSISSSTSSNDFMSSTNRWKKLLGDWIGCRRIGIKLAFQKWALDDTPEEKSELTNLLKTLTRQQDSKSQMKMKCEGCKLESDFCNCTLNEIMFENTFQVRSLNESCFMCMVVYASSRLCKFCKHLGSGSV